MAFFKLLTEQEMRDIYAAAVQSVKASLDNFTPGSGLDALSSASVGLAEVAIQQIHQKFLENFFSYSTGRALEARGIDQAGPDGRFLEASPSVGHIDITPSSGAVPYTIPEGTVLSGTLDDGTQVEVETVVDAVLTDVRLYEVPVRALSSGRATNYPEGTITAFSTFADDPSPTIEQSVRMAGGSEHEKDREADYIERMRNYNASPAVGTEAAIRRRLQLIPGVKYVNFVKFDTEFGTHITEVHVGDPDGAGNAQIVTQVEEALPEVVVLNDKYEVVASEREEVTMQLRIYVNPGVKDTTAMEARCREAALGYINNLPTGEQLRISKLMFYVLGAEPSRIEYMETNPKADIYPTARHKAIRILNNALSIEIREAD